jgi:hypothetical protein
VTVSFFSERWQIILRCFRRLIPKQAKLGSRGAMSREGLTLSLLLEVVRRHIGYGIVQTS